MRLDYKMSAPMENGRFECKNIININNVDLCLLSAQIDVMKCSYNGVDYLEYACTCI